jgi:hypothetical protein
LQLTWKYCMRSFTVISAVPAEGWGAIMHRFFILSKSDLQDSGSEKQYLARWSSFQCRCFISSPSLSFLTGSLQFENLVQLCRFSKPTA